MVNSIDERKDKIRFDPHNHYKTSSVLTSYDFRRVVKMSSERLGDRGIAGLVNFADKRYEQFVNSDVCKSRGLELGKEKNAMYFEGEDGDNDAIVVKGQEIPTRQGHILAMGLGYEKHVRQYRTFEDTLKEVKDLGAIAILDHPFYVEGAGKYVMRNPHLLEQIDAVEIHNGEASFGLLPSKWIESMPLPSGLKKLIPPIKANKNARGFYNMFLKQYPHLGAISTSDGHSISEWFGMVNEFGTSWTEIDEPETNANFVESLRNSVRNASHLSRRSKHKSYLGAMNHILDLVWITKIAPKFGLAKKFDTERPEYYLPPGELPEDKSQ